MLLWLVSGSALAAPVLSADGDVASAGYYRLSWSQDGVPGVYELQEAQRSDFGHARTLYRGPDRATVLSGRSDGMRWYRVRDLPADGAPGDWSAPLRVETRHHSLTRAFGFFAAGVVVFLATFGLILTGGRMESRS